MDYNPQPSENYYEPVFDEDGSSIYSNTEQLPNALYNDFCNYPISFATNEHVHVASQSNPTISSHEVQYDDNEQVSFVPPTYRPILNNEQDIVQDGNNQQQQCMTTSENVVDIGQQSPPQFIPNELSLQINSPYMTVYESLDYHVILIPKYPLVDLNNLQQSYVSGGIPISENYAIQSAVVTDDSQVATSTMNV